MKISFIERRVLHIQENIILFKESITFQSRKFYLLKVGIMIKQRTLPCFTTPYLFKRKYYGQQIVKYCK